MSPVQIGISCLVVSNSVVTSWIVACQAPLFMELSKQEYWTELLFPFLGDLPNSGIKPESPALTGAFFTIEPSEKPPSYR